MLLPGYNSPSRTAVGNHLLDEVHKDVSTSCRQRVEGKVVSMELDGWSNIHNEPVVCTSITTYVGDIYLTSTIDTQD